MGMRCIWQGLNKDERAARINGIVGSHVSPEYIDAPALLPSTSGYTWKSIFQCSDDILIDRSALRHVDMICGRIYDET